MRTQTLLLLLCGLIAACGKRKDATPMGVSVIDWDLSKSSRSSVTSAKVTARVPKDLAVTWTPGLGHPVTAALHVETGNVEFTEAGSTVHQTSVVGVSFKVTGND